MKTFLLALLISTAALAETKTPVGVYQMDATHSKVVSFDKTTHVNGCIELSDDFATSKLTVESPEVSFESSEFIGTIDNFEVKGMLTFQGVTSLVTLKGHYFGMTHNEFGNKTAFNFVNKDLNLKVFAAKPSESSTAIYKVVQEIVE
jgi:polyisoprenoid-binding protein YceI